jgi:hypothetical protein
MSANVMPAGAADPSALAAAGGAAAAVPINSAAFADIIHRAMSGVMNVRAPAEAQLQELERTNFVRLFYFYFNLFIYFIVACVFV